MTIKNFKKIQKNLLHFPLFCVSFIGGKIRGFIILLISFSFTQQVVILIIKKQCVKMKCKDYQSELEYEEGK